VVQLLETPNQGIPSLASFLQMGNHGPGLMLPLISTPLEREEGRRKVGNRVKREGGWHCWVTKSNIFCTKYLDIGPII